MKKLLFAFAFIIASVQASLPDWYADPVYNVAAVRQAVGDDQPLTATAEAALF